MKRIPGDFKDCGWTGQHRISDKPLLRSDRAMVKKLFSTVALKAIQGSIRPPLARKTFTETTKGNLMNRWLEMRRKRDNYDKVRVITPLPSPMVRKWMAMIFLMWNPGITLGLHVDT